MCQICDQNNLSDPNEPDKTLHRRSFLKFGAASTFAFCIAAAAQTTFAEDAHVHPLPENELTPDAALERLMTGNERYASGQSNPLNFTRDREALRKGQNPYACILSCADSRVGPEFAFDEQRGDLFVSRVAGNYVTLDFVATLEYAALILHTPIIMVLGHESCGAAKAAINAVDNDQQFPGHIQILASALAPAVRAVSHMPGDRYQNVIKENVIQNVEKLRHKTPVLHKLAMERKIRIVGGVYSLKTGKVELVAT